MVDKIPLKIENGTISQFSIGDTISPSYLPATSATSNKLTSDLTLASDTSYLVISYFDTNGFSLTVNGNFGIYG